MSESKSKLAIELEDLIARKFSDGKAMKLRNDDNQKKGIQFAKDNLF